jgi:hypothetical protein
LAARILTFRSKKTDVTKLGKPRLDLMINPNTSLMALVGPKTEVFLEILELGCDWLTKDPSQWELDPNYMEARTYVRTVKVTNDLAERGIKVWN